MTHPEMQRRRAPRRAGQDQGILDTERIQESRKRIGLHLRGRVLGISDPRYPNRDGTSSR
jgi:hypothetical protein